MLFEEISIVNKKRLPLVVNGWNLAILGVVKFLPTTIKIKIMSTCVCVCVCVYMHLSLWMCVSVFFPLLKYLIYIICRIYSGSCISWLLTILCIFHSADITSNKTRSRFYTFFERFVSMKYIKLSPQNRHIGKYSTSIFKYRYTPRSENSSQCIPADKFFRARRCLIGSCS